MALKNLAKTLNKERKVKPPQEEFLAMLDKVILELDEEKEPQPQDRIRPSQIHKCERSIWYSLKKFPMQKKKYPRSVRILDIGTAHHEWIQAILMKCITPRHGIRLIMPDEMATMLPKGVEWVKDNSKGGDDKYMDLETRFRDHRVTSDIPVTGSCDGMMELDWLPGEVVAFEYKTINQDDFQYLIQPLKKHILQGAFYCYGFGIRKVLFLYENKNKQEFKAFIYEYTDAQIDWIERKIKRLVAARTSNELPDKNPFDDKECQYCEYRWACDQNLTEIPDAKK